MFLLHILFAFSKYDKIVLEKVMKELRLLKVIHLGIDGHGDYSMKIFGGRKPCYDGQ